MDFVSRIADDHCEVTRRFFLGLGAAGLAGLSFSQRTAAADEVKDALAQAIADLEYLTPDEEFRNVGRGNPVPSDLPDETLPEVGLTRETWKLEVLADPESKPRVRNPLTIEKGNAFTWADLMDLSKEHAVRFFKVMSCNNIGPPLGTGLWEGVPLSHVFWKTQPSEAIRRVYFYGYHNDDPKQLFQSSLPVGRVLEAPPGVPPVILCYKLNGEYLSMKRGAPVRVLVPEAYGFKSIKWLKRVVLTDKWKANDTYGEKKNDIDSRMKTMARFIASPSKKTIKAGEPIPLTGLAQVGMSGLKKVQYWLHPQDKPLPEGDRYFSKGDWQDAEILPPPKTWGGGLPDERLTGKMHEFNEKTGQPQHWPLRYAIVHWAALLKDIPPGKYDLRCRTLDANNIAQPLPRPFPKSGRNAIEMVSFTVEG